MIHIEGLSYLLEGEPDRADPIFAHAFDDATDWGRRRWRPCCSPTGASSPPAVTTGRQPARSPIRH